MCGLIVANCAQTGAPIDELAELLTGTFDTHAEATDLPLDSRFVDSRTRIDAPLIGTHVFYQQLNKSAALELYRQRIVVLSVDADDATIIQHSYALTTPEQFVDGGAAEFRDLTPDALQNFMAAGCEQRWRRTNDGFRGYVDPARCRIISSRTGKQRGIESEAIINTDELYLVERGYDASSGQQLFGTPQGESLRLNRVQ